MINKFQKFDAILSYLLTNREDLFENVLFLKIILQKFFVDFCPAMTPKLHSMSTENINFILNMVNNFTDEETDYALGLAQDSIEDT